MNQLEEIQEQLRTIESELETTPSDGTLWMEKGVGHYLCGDYEASLHALKQATTLQPGNPSVLYNLGNTLTEMERLEEAADHYLQVLEHRPDHIPALNNLADLWEQLGKPERSHALFQQLTLLAPEDPLPHFNLGNFFLRQDQPIEACKCYQMSLDLDPTFTDAWHNIGWVLYRSGAMQQAAEYLVKGLEHDPDHEEMTTLLAQVQEAIQEMNNAGSCGSGCGCSHHSPTS